MSLNAKEAYEKFQNEHAFCEAIPNNYPHIGDEKLVVAECKKMVNKNAFKDGLKLTEDSLRDWIKRRTSTMKPLAIKPKKKMLKL